jgi:plastocyanin domain-containing protein
MMNTPQILLSVLGLTLLASPAVAEKPRRIEIAVTSKGFDPGTIAIKKGEPVALVFTRTTESSCMKEVIVNTDGGKAIQKELPLNKAVTIPVTFKSSGELAYTCGMKMATGTITVK